MPTRFNPPPNWPRPTDRRRAPSCAGAGSATSTGAWSATTRGLARSMAVGRPDVARSYSDGGLLDLNALPIVALVEFGPMSTDDAQRIVARRRQLGRMTSLSDLASAGVTQGTLDRLRDIAVFL